MKQDKLPRREAILSFPFFCQKKEVRSSLVPYGPWGHDPIYPWDPWPPFPARPRRWRIRPLILGSSRSSQSQPPLPSFPSSTSLAPTRCLPTSVHPSDILRLFLPSTTATVLHPPRQPQPAPTSYLQSFTAAYDLSLRLSCWSGVPKVTGTPQWQT
jgi:hypothetical protein